uniref:Uncharacterized protein n=1 Tax=Megaselia scalaris TaxID=36166 RepID=T1GC71_MEGSC
MGRLFATSGAKHDCLKSILHKSNWRQKTWSSETKMSKAGGGRCKIAKHRNFVNRGANMSENCVRDFGFYKITAMVLLILFLIFSISSGLKLNRREVEGETIFVCGRGSRVFGTSEQSANFISQIFQEFVSTIIPSLFTLSADSILALSIAFIT